jgi:transposase-like protein
VDGARRGRPGRRTADERSRAVLELLAGKASVDQLALRFGVQASTIERWRELALESVTAGLRQGTARSARELDLEKQLGTLKAAFTDLAIRHELVQKALKDHPSRPGRSPR